MKLDLWLNKRAAMTHASNTYGPRTLCGKVIEGDQWQREQHHRCLDESFVECKRCRSALKKEASQ